MKRAFLLMLVVLAGAMGGMSATAEAKDTVKCMSRDYQYDECWAGPLRQPQLIHQKSSSPCILNKTWGYNPRSGYIWVANGCGGVFADVAGYHYGRGGGYDPNARAYDEHGHDIGAVIGTAVIDGLVDGMKKHKHKDHRYTTSNVSDDSDGYNGCHGKGCLVDSPDDDTASSFDKNGNYQGCHGVGCLVDNPDGN